MINIILAALIGSFLGVITGIIPGVHVNLLATIIVALSSLYLGIFSPLTISIFILAIAISHTFCKAIPATFLGIAEENTIFNLLPSHKMLLEGKGYEAVKLTIIGSLLGAVAIILISPLLLISIDKVYPIIKNYIPYLLIISSLFLIYKEKFRTWAFVIFIISGIFGILTFNVPNIKEVLLPMLSGLFGLSSILLSLKDKIKVSKQEINKEKIKDLKLPKSIGIGLIASLLVGFLPGLGSAQGAGISSIITLYATRFIANKISKLNYKKIGIIVSIFIVLLVTIVSGPLGLFILLISTIIGTLPVFFKVSRSQLMGCLIIPVIIYLI